MTPVRLNQVPWSVEATPFWEIFPDIRRDGRRVNLEEAAKGLPAGLQLSLEVEGERIQMELQHNRHLLPASHRLTYYLPNGTRVTEEDLGLEHCYYHGRVKEQTGWWSSLSLCSGLSGVLVLSPDRSYSIEPVPGDPSHAHILRRSRGNLLQNVRCGTAEDPHQVTTPHRTQSPPHRRKRDVMNETKYIELVMVADNREYKMFHGNLKSLHMRMLEIANKVDAFYRELNIRVALLSAEVWSAEDLVSVSADAADTLNRFLVWREKKLLPRLPHDNAQLLTGIRFEGSAVGMSSMNSMCTADRSGGVNMDHSVSVIVVAATVAHALGHNLGLSHDTPDRKCVCPEQVKTCIMELSNGFTPGRVFSSCSRADLDFSLRQGGGKCLFNVPYPKTLFGEARCGNTFVEEGEQCDCGLTEECTDPCCNATSCRLVSGAECSLDGLCCEQCKLKRSGSVCRDRQGECDLPEYCNGVSPHCPPNVFLSNGEPCESGQASCYLGQCRTLRAQCQQLWGPGSSAAPDGCFSKVNNRGDKYGNCGQGPNSTYLPCAERDTRCGKIQCQGGSERPLFDSDAEMVTVNVTVSGTQISCRMTHFNLSEDIWVPALVMSGTVCGAGKVCVNQRCRDLGATRSVQNCKSKCSGHGVCNSNNNCHCDPGWAPPGCGSAGHGGSTDSGSLAPEQAGSALTTALLLLFLLFLPLVLLTGICYLKRKIIQTRLGKLSKGSSCQYRVTRTHGQSRPQRPPPPHWTQSTELQVMSANSKGSDRPDPPSKPLPPDPVHKRCQADAQDRPPPPSRPLPADPLPRRAQAPDKPPPPKKPLPSDPLLQTQDPPLTVPAYPDHIIALPSRPAPPPPDGVRTPRV
ncbi:disintegrin and metalloproteinase domain-containing protein 15 [Ascaphus truei]|uniref:disintegrin and metalloproteinase domain-containing protein 15 n=1 Tax=Ascaphus truei TaxID=8439 RepID=UPI003F5902B0